MSWLTPELIDIVVAVLKSIVILLAVVVSGALSQAPNTAVAPTMIQIVLVRFTAASKPGM